MGFLYCRFSLVIFKACGWGIFRLMGLEHNFSNRQRISVHHNQTVFIIIIILSSLGADMDVCLMNYGHCNYVSGKHACIFYDEVTDMNASLSDLVQVPDR